MYKNTIDFIKLVEYISDIVKYKQVRKKAHKFIRNEISISPNNRITYVFKERKTSENREIIEVTCVSLEIRYKEKWTTIVYYDSSHAGVLHRHVLISFDDNSDIVEYDRVPRKRDQRKLLEWAIKDIQKNYLFYKKSFIKRTIFENDNQDIEIY